MKNQLHHRKRNVKATKKFWELDKIVCMLESRVKLVGSVRRFARAYKFSPSHISRVLRGQKKPGKKLLHSLGVKRVVMYESTEP